MRKCHEVEKITFKKDSMTLNIDGSEFTFKLADISERLANASDIERSKYEISASGYGIHWPLIDEDLSIDGLLGIKHQPEKKKQAVSPK